MPIFFVKDEFRHIISTELKVLIIYIAINHAEVRIVQFEQRNTKR